MRIRQFVQARRGWILMACIGLVALALRGPIVAVAPVVGPIRDQLGLSAAEAGLLTSIPVLCFAVAAPLASRIIRRAGAEFAITLTLAGVLLGTCVRSAGGTEVTFLGTVVIGLAITLGNIAVPLIIRRDFPPRRHGTATGVYTAALNIGSMIAALSTAALADVVGWRPALAAGVLAVLVGAACWIPAVGARQALLPEAVDPDARAKERAAGPVQRGGWTTAALTVGFAGQAFAYYGVTAWLPTLLHDETGMNPAEAGAASSIFQILAIVGGLGVPLAARRLRTSTVALILGVCWTAVPLGLLFDPGLWWLWTTFGGAAQGGGITIIFIAIIQLARSNAMAGRISAIVQGTGYSFGALAPSVIGLVHGQSGSWPAALLTVLAAVVAFMLCTTLGVRSDARRRAALASAAGAKVGA